MVWFILQFGLDFIACKRREVEKKERNSLVWLQEQNEEDEGANMSF